MKESVTGSKPDQTAGVTVTEKQRWFQPLSFVAPVPGVPGRYRCPVQHLHAACAPFFVIKSSRRYVRSAVTTASVESSAGEIKTNRDQRTDVRLWQTRRPQAAAPSPSPLVAAAAPTVARDGEPLFHLIP